MTDAVVLAILILIAIDLWNISATLRELVDAIRGEDKD